MAINPTLNYLLARQSDIILAFSGAVTTITADLGGAGGLTGDGFPIPRTARALKIECWDGIQRITADCNLKLNPGDRVAVRAVAAGGLFNVTLLVNGVVTTAAANGAAQNSNLFATLLVRLLG